MDKGKYIIILDLVMLGLSIYNAMATTGLWRIIAIILALVFIFDIITIKVIAKRKRERALNNLELALISGDALTLMSIVSEEYQKYLHVDEKRDYVKGLKKAIEALSKIPDSGAFILIPKENLEMVLKTYRDIRVWSFVKYSEGKVFIDSALKGKEEDE
ncbi:MAG: hypothetical protein QXL94_04370 [Candidatus Parvarchaeum sp.]